jgi:predicted DNA-binding transcriptional regulator YafY
MKEQPPSRPGQLASSLLKFLVFGALAFVLYQATAVHGAPSFDNNWMWVTIADMASLLLLLAVDRLTQLEVTPGGLKASLSQVQAQAIKETAAMQDAQVAQAAQAQILEAKSPEQVEDAVAMAIELNVTKIISRVQQAIEESRRIYIRYRTAPEQPIETIEAAPVEIKSGSTENTRRRDYLWVYSYEHNHPLSLRLERVLGVELSEETFDPGEVQAAFE